MAITVERNTFLGGNTGRRTMEARIRHTSQIQMISKESSCAVIKAEEDPGA